MRGIRKLDERFSPSYLIAPYYYSLCIGAGVLINTGFFLGWLSAHYADKAVGTKVHTSSEGMSASLGALEAGGGIERHNDMPSTGFPVVSLVCIPLRSSSQ